MANLNPIAAVHVSTVNTPPTASGSAVIRQNPATAQGQWEPEGICDQCDGEKGYDCFCTCIGCGSKQDLRDVYLHPGDPQDWDGYAVCRDCEIEAVIP